MTPPDPTPTRSALCNLTSAGVRFPRGKRVDLGDRVAALEFGRRAVACLDVVNNAAGC